MQQCSHQILKSGFVLSALTICRNPHGFVEIGRRFLESKNFSIRVIRLVLAAVDAACQHKHSCRGYFGGLDPVAVIDSK
jgi:hypothetical protein